MGYNISNFPGLYDDSIRTSGDASAQITYGWMGWQEAET